MANAKETAVPLAVRPGLWLFAFVVDSFVGVRERMSNAREQYRRSTEWLCTDDD
jgi:hypothetical protein